MSDPRTSVFNIWLEPLTPRAYLQPCNLSYILSPLPWAHVRTWIILFSTYPAPYQSYFESKFGNLSAFSNYIFELIVLHVDEFFSFFSFFHLSIFDLPCCVSGVQQSDSALHIHVFGLPTWLSCSRVTLQWRRFGFNPWVGKICSEWHDEPLQYSCLENLIDRGA